MEYTTVEKTDKLVTKSRFCKDGRVKQSAIKKARCTRGVPTTMRDHHYLQIINIGRDPYCDDFGAYAQVVLKTSKVLGSAWSVRWVSANSTIFELGGDLACYSSEGDDSDDHDPDDWRVSAVRRRLVIVEELGLVNLAADMRDFLKRNGG